MPGPRPKPPMERFMAKVEKHDGGCWLWTGYVTPLGYGRFAVGSRNVVRAHRWSYEQAKGPVPEGTELDHLCRQKACVNPDHLEPVPHKTNMHRIPNFPGARTECRNGHEFTPENTRIHSRGGRICRTCAREAERARKLRLRGESHG